jgi:hypothetical protein
MPANGKRAPARLNAAIRALTERGEIDAILDRYHRRRHGQAGTGECCAAVAAPWSKWYISA